jgi:3-hydroxymyristoyl/3-hydroxydecanoyl-(acyl carrier protein) dehydratase
VTLSRKMRGIWIYKARASVADVVVAEAELMCSAQDKK